MNTFLWVLQSLLALIFLVTGIRKLIRTDAQTRAVPWVRDTPVPVVRAIGVLETLGAIGVVLPALTGILPWLTPVAALGLMGLMLGAAWVNYRAQLYRPIVVNIVILLLAVVLAYGRFAGIGV